MVDRKVKIRPTDLSEIIDLIASETKSADDHREVCMLKPVTDLTTIRELRSSAGFLIVEDDEPVPDEPAESSEPKPKAPPRQLDHGKIIALYNAGWSYQQIADEMRCTMQTVLNHVKKEEAKKAEAQS